MKVFISGPITEQDLADADMLMGIVPTEFLTNGVHHPPASDIPVTVYPPDPMHSEDSRVQSAIVRAAVAADAAIVTDNNAAVLKACALFGLQVYRTNA